MKTNMNIKFAKKFMNFSCMNVYICSSFHHENSKDRDEHVKCSCDMNKLIVQMNNFEHEHENFHVHFIMNLRNVHRANCSCSSCTSLPPTVKKIVFEPNSEQP